MPPCAQLAPPQSVLIVGAGEMGALTALSLAEGLYKSHPHLITVVERGAEPPAIDAASSDYNKVRPPRPNNLPRNFGRRRRTD